MRLRHLLPAILILGGAAPAAAQIMGEPTDPYPDTRKFATGLYGEAEAGTVLFMGEAGKPIGPGAALGLRLGFDLLRFLALQVHGAGSTHTTRFPGRPQSGQLLQIYTATAELKLTVPLGQWAPFAFGGGGIARLSTNLLGTAGLTDPDLMATPVMGGGAGVDYHTRSRHFSFGASAAFFKLQKLATTGALSAAAHVRYTF